MDGEIAQLVSACLAAFSTVKDGILKAEERIKSKITEGVLADEVGRFQIWVGNSGAHKRGRSSLDYKLREASHIQSQAVKLLENMLAVLNDMGAIIEGDRTPWEDFSDSESDDMATDSPPQEEPNLVGELTQLLSNLADINTYLMRLSVAIRNPAPHNHFKAFANIDISHFERYDTQHVQEKFPNLGLDLVARLGGAISRRRQYLLYRQGHRARLGAGLGTGTEPSIADVESTVISSLPSRMKNSPKALLLEDDEHYNDLGSETSYSSSHNDLTKLRPPTMPEAARDGKPFECPLCYRFTSVNNFRAWIKHVYQDLRPYVCTFTNCTTSHQSYESRHEWFDHELQAHRAWWDCLEGCNEVFESSERLRMHIHQAHAELATDQRLEDIIKTRLKQVSPKAEAQCPFCSEHLGSLMRLRHHLGKHQEELALFSLPSHLVEDRGDGYDDSDNECDDIIHVQERRIGDPNPVSSEPDKDMLLGAFRPIVAESPQSQDSNINLGSLRSKETLLEQGEAQHGTWSAGDSDSARFEYPKGEQNVDSSDSSYSKERYNDHTENEHTMDNAHAMAVSLDHSEIRRHDQQLEMPINRQSEPGLKGKKTVGFNKDPIQAVSRPVSNAESWAIYDFELHARKCVYCHDPYEVHRNHEQLCELGHRLAQEVCAYIYLRDGQYLSTKNEDNKMVRVEIHLNQVEVASLLKAVERSLRHRSRRPFVSMDRSYHVTQKAPAALTKGNAFKSEDRSERHHSSRVKSLRPRDGGTVQMPDISKRSESSPSRGTLYNKKPASKRQEGEQDVEVSEPPSLDL